MLPQMLDLILKDWLDLRSIMQLDSAITNKVLRPQFLDCLANTSITVTSLYLYDPNSEAVFRNHHNHRYHLSIYSDIPHKSASNISLPWIFRRNINCQVLFIGDDDGGSRNKKVDSNQAGLFQGIDSLKSLRYLNIDIIAFIY